MPRAGLSHVASTPRFRLSASLPSRVWALVKGNKEACFCLFFFFEAVIRGDFPYGPVLRTSPSSAEGAGSIPGRGPKIPHALQSENRGVKQKQYCNKFKKDFKNGPHQKNF